MRLTTRINLLMRIHSLIKRKGTGTPIQFARRLDISRATLFRLLRDLKDDFEAPIQYCKSRQSYFYSSNYKFDVSFGEIEPVSSVSAA